MIIDEQTKDRVRERLARATEEPQGADYIGAVACLLDRVCALWFDALGKTDDDTLNMPEALYALSLAHSVSRGIGEGGDEQLRYLMYLMGLVGMVGAEHGDSRLPPVLADSPIFDKTESMAALKLIREATSAVLQGKHNATD